MNYKMIFFLFVIIFTLKNPKVLAVREKQNHKPELKIKTTFEYTTRMKTDLDGLKFLAGEKYISEVDRYREKIEKYLDHKLRVCRGEFSTLILDEGGIGDSQEKKQRYKLTSKEKKLCLQELKAIYITYVENLYLARKNYMILEFENRKKELAKNRDQIVKEMNKTNFFYRKKSFSTAF